MTLDYKDRINMQSIWQKHIDASISSTVNVPENFTTSDVFDLYIKAWEKGLKGVTIFRDNCRRTGILLNTAPTPSKEENFEFDSVKPISRAALGKTYGTTTKYKTACGNLYVTINRDKSGNIVESFVNTSKNGICKSNIDGLNRMIFLCLRSGVLVDEIIDQLKNITCPACVRYKTKGEYLDGISCPDIIAKALKEEYTTELFVGGFKGKEEKEDVDQVAFNLSEDINTMTHCPECGEQLRHEAGCVQCVCGWSKCM